MHFDKNSVGESHGQELKYLRNDVRGVMLMTTASIRDSNDNLV